MKYLIVAADDFGLNKSINEGIVKAYREGIVTSLNFMPAGADFKDALDLAKSLDLKEIGAHLCLTETAPLSDPTKIPTLVTKNGGFHNSYVQFFTKLFLKKIDLQEIRVELRKQLNALKTAGIPIKNLSSHEHIHMMPAITGIFIELAKEFDIPSIRYLHNDRLVAPFRLGKIYKLMTLRCFGGRMGRLLDDSGIAHADDFIGLADSGNMEEETLLRLLTTLKDGTTELVCHPGFLSPEVLDRCVFHLNCESDLAALTSKRAKRMIEEENIKLVTYGEFLVKRR
jgi:hopanoid biosynthesis associated protein HpnK